MAAGTGNLVVNVDVTSAHTDIQKMGVVGDRTLQGGVEYTLVYASASVASAGLGLKYNTDGPGYVSIVAATTDRAAGIPAVASTASIAASSYFWMAVRGPVTVGSDLVSTALVSASAIGFSTGAKLVPLANSVGNNAGHSPASIATNASGIVMLDCAG